MSPRVHVDAGDGASKCGRSIGAGVVVAAAGELADCRSCLASVLADALADTRRLIRDRARRAASAERARARRELIADDIGAADPWQGDAS